MLRERERARSGLGVGDRFHGVESETSARNISFYMLGMFVHRPLCMLQFRVGSYFSPISYFRRPFAMHVFYVLLSVYFLARLAARGRFTQFLNHKFTQPSIDMAANTGYSAALPKRNVVAK